MEIDSGIKDLANSGKICGKTVKKLTVFSPQQLREIEKTTLGRIFCENGDAISKMTTNVFLMSSSQVPCEHLLEHGSLDLEKWTDTCEHKITVQ